MADAYIGEIRALPYNRVPVGWLRCNGTIYPVAEYTALFAVIWNRFGGNGNTTFAVPDLSGTAAMGVGHGPGLMDRQWGDYGGYPLTSLQEGHNPSHRHTMTSGYGTPGDETQTPDSKSILAILTDPNAQPAYSDQPANIRMNANVLSGAGQSMAHENRQPFLSVQYFINYDGYFPPRPSS